MEISVNYAVRLYYLILFVAVFVQSAKTQTLIPDGSLIKSIYFGGGSYYISRQQAIGLKEWLKSFPDIEGYTITVHSHTDNIGSPEYNQMLAEMRSYASIQQLLKLNISRSRISIQNFGEFNPVYDNNSPRGRIMNRRVDIILWPIESL